MRNLFCRSVACAHVARADIAHFAMRLEGPLEWVLVLAGARVILDLEADAEVTLLRVEDLVLHMLVVVPLERDMRHWIPPVGDAERWHRLADGSVEGLREDRASYARRLERVQHAQP